MCCWLLLIFFFHLVPVTFPPLIAFSLGLFLEYFFDDGRGALFWYFCPLSWCSDFLTRWDLVSYLSTFMTFFKVFFTLHFFCYFDVNMIWSIWNSQLPKSLLFFSIILSQQSLNHNCYFSSFLSALSSSSSFFFAFRFISILFYSSSSSFSFFF